MKLLRKKSTKSQQQPIVTASTKELKMQEYNRKYSTKKEQSNNNKNNKKKSKRGGGSLNLYDSSSSNSKQQQQQQSSISVNGQPILGINPTAKLEDVEAFVSSLQNTTNNDDVNVTSDYEEKLGKSFRNLQRSLAKKCTTSKTVVQEEKAAENEAPTATTTDEVVKAVLEQELFVNKEGGSIANEVLEDDVDSSFPAFKDNIFPNISPALLALDEAALEDPELPCNMSDETQKTTHSAHPTVQVVLDKELLDDITRPSSFDPTDGRSSSPVGVDDEISLEPSIEAVSQNDEILLGWYDPDKCKVSKKDKGEEEEGDAFYLEDVGYALSLVIDGVVLHTMTVGAAAVELLSRISDAVQKCQGQELINQDPEECTKGAISPMQCRIVNDLSQEETDGDVNEMSEEPEQSFIHPFILEKWNCFSLGSGCGKVEEQQAV